MGMDDEARQLWAACTFLRLAVDRDRTVAIRVLRHLSRSSDARIAAKAAQALQDHEND